MRMEPTGVFAVNLAVGLLQITFKTFARATYFPLSINKKYNVLTLLLDINFTLMMCSIPIIYRPFTIKPGNYKNY